MIVTLTPNPALDVTVETAVVRPGEKLRCTEVRYDPGGGGINVARVAHALGAEAMAVFPVGGLTGRRVVHLMEAAGVPISPVTISGLVRESFTVDEASTGRQFRFVLPGPALTAGEQRRLLDTFAQALGSDTYAVASGSLPPGVSADFYNDVARIARDRGVRLALDSSGLALNGLRTPVFLLKPSIRELSELVSRVLSTPDEQLAAARGLVDAGLAEVVLVSLAAEGVLLVTATQHCRLPAIPVPPGSGVGAGDALVAGTVLGLDRGWALSDAVAYGMAAAAAMLLSPGTAVCHQDDVERLFASRPVDAAAPSAPDVCQDTPAGGR